MPDNNPFAMLGLPVAFDLDVEAVRRAYLTRAAAIHPDRETDPMLQAELTEKAAELNAAHTTLHDPIARAEAILAVRHPELVQGEDSAGTTSLPPQFLAEVMEIREEVDDAEGEARDAAVQQALDWAQSRMDQDLIELADLLEQDDAKGARQKLGMLRYTRRLIDQLG